MGEVTRLHGSHDADLKVSREDYCWREVYSTKSI
jgi:hypothetical protein